MAGWGCCDVVGWGIVVGLVYWWGWGYLEEGRKIIIWEGISLVLGGWENKFWKVTNFNYLCLRFTKNN
jgi:hypothetical protein